MASRDTRIMPLTTWLERVNAREVNTYQSDAKGHEMRLYLINGKLCAVSLAYNPRKFVTSWELFIPAHPGNNIALTLDAAALALGVEGCAGIEGVE